MLVADYDIVFQEVPDETTLALNISQCPHDCPGCHSPHLRQNVGEQLTEQWLDKLIERYSYITCISIQGGDKDWREVEEIARLIRRKGYKSCWYSGSTHLPEQLDFSAFDFIKVGPFVEALGGLKSHNTNQRFYKVENGKLIDQTPLFWRK